MINLDFSLPLKLKHIMFDKAANYKFCFCKKNLACSMSILIYHDNSPTCAVFFINDRNNSYYK